MAEIEPEPRLLPTTIPIGIYSETHPLRSAALWGPVGAEAVLSQVYPKTKSLFYDDMNVPLAREEMQSFALLLDKGFDVRVASVRDFLATKAGESSNGDGLSREALRTSLQQRAVDIYNEHKGQRGAIKKSRLHDLTDQLDEVLELDHALYGEPNSVALNKMLCLDPEMPLGNLIFARDQMNVLLGTRFVSNMAKPIRRPEVGLYEKFYAENLGNQPKVKIPVGEVFEGGDAYVHNGYVYVGVGDRTSMSAAVAIYESLRPQLDEQDLRFAIVEDPKPASRAFSKRMDFMHLDTFSNPIGDKEIAVCTAEAEYRRIRLVSILDGQMTMSDGNKSFLDHLEETEDNVLPISSEEQQAFGCNFLTLDDDKIIVPRVANRAINNALRRQGKAVLMGNLDESTKGYGAAHCMTGQLRRAL